MKRALFLTAIFLTLGASAAFAQVLTFDEPESQQSMINVIAGVNGSKTLYFSGDAKQWSYGDVVLTSVGLTSIVRSTFDDRSPSPYPYRFISGNVMQVRNNKLRID